jgi:D-glycerate 3-kinase
VRSNRLKTGTQLDLTKLQQQLAWAAENDVNSGDKNNISRGFADWQLISSALAPMIIQQGLSVVAICGSQGSGKSTLAEYLVSAISDLGVSAVAVSLDDFYLTQAQRRLLAQSVHPLLQTRGVPGTHDVELLQQTLQTFAQSKTQSKTEAKPAVAGAKQTPLLQLSLPKFNKGIDDRQGFRQVEASVLVLEGWCLGVQPEPEQRLENAINSLEDVEDEGGHWRRWVNAQIGNRYAELWPQIDYWVQLNAPSFAQVHQWRGQQEARLPKPQRMSEAQINRFIEHYQRLTLWQWQSPNLQPGLQVALAEDHRVKAVSLS